jgi:hypothetical protein
MKRKNPGQDGGDGTPMLVWTMPTPLRHDAPPPYAHPSTFRLLSGSAAVVREVHFISTFSIERTRLYILAAHRTSTGSNYYTGLIETSKKHFYGRAAAGPSFSDLVLGTFTGTLKTVIA